jgi:hypothetical protein
VVCAIPDLLSLRLVKDAFLSNIVPRSIKQIIGRNISLVVW